MSPSRGQEPRDSGVCLRLLQLESEIRRSLVAGEITEGHARLQFPRRDRVTKRGARW